jgi:hypothetical protein
MENIGFLSMLMVLFNGRKYEQCKENTETILDAGNEVKLEINS